MNFYTPILLGFPETKARNERDGLLFKRFLSLNKYFFAVFMGLAMQFSHAQNELTKWYFGNMAALDFMTNPPTILLNSAMGTPEGSSSIADASGNLLFYTNGITVWNAAHVPMANGTGLNGGISSTQSALIIRQPGSASLYYIFNTKDLNQSPGLSYSIVDMSLAAGMGSVTVKNAILNAAPSAEKLHATRHINGQDYWVVIREMNVNNHNFAAYLLTATGMNTTAVVSTVGNNYAPSTGQMKISPTGQKLGIGSGTLNAVFDFDNSTGAVTNSLLLTNAGGSYGCEFSPDGTKFYTGLYSGTGTGVTQWNLAAGSNAAIIASQVNVGGVASANARSMQLAIDGKIYCAAQTSLHVIHNPNTAGAACNFTLSGQWLGGRNSSLGLPNLVPQPCLTFTTSTSNASCFGTTTGSAAVTAVSGSSGTPSYTWNNGITTFTTQQLNNVGAGTWTVTVNDLLCSASSTVSILQPPPLTLSLTSSSASACVNGTITVNAFASGGTGAISYSCLSAGSGNTFSVVQNTAGPHICSVTAIDANGCVTGSTTALNFLQTPVLSSLTSQSICPNTSVTLGVSGADTYTWLPGGSNASSISVSPAVPTQYSVTGTNTLTGCTSSQTVQVNLWPIPSLAIHHASITCATLGFGTVVATGVPGPFSYTWSPTNQTTAIANNLNTSVYTVSVLDHNTGCIATATAQYLPLVPLAGQLNSQPAFLCHGAGTGTANFVNVINGSGSETYSWTNGTISHTASAPQNLTAGSWSVTVTDVMTACQIYSVFTISQPPAITLNIASGTPTACAGSAISFTANASGGTAGYSYQWTSGPPGTTHTVNETTAGPAVYTVSATDANTCTLSNTVAVNFIANPQLIVTNASICPLQTGTVTVSGATSYTWNNSSNNSSITDNPLITTVYTVTGEALGCTSTETATITLKPIPNALAASNSPRCEQTLLHLFANGGTGYQWNGPQGFSSSQQNPLINSVQLNNAGVYNVTATAANGCTAAASATVVVNAIPTVAVTGQTVCTTQTLNLTANSVAGASFLWSGPNGFTSSVQNPVLGNPPLAASGNYSVKVTSAQGCTNTSVTHGSVVTPPSLTTSLSSPSLCAQAFNGSPNSIMLNAAGGVTYTLTTPNHINTSSPPPWSLISVPPYSTTIVITTASLVGSNGVCTSSTTASFSVIPNPTVTVNSFTPVICAGESFTYTSDGANSYVWSATTPNYTSVTNGGIIVANPTINSVFSVFGSSLGCQSALVTSSITVHPLPEVSVTPTQTDICIGSPAVLIAYGNATEYKWLPPNGLSSTSDATVFAKPLTETQYIVIGTANNCTRMAVANVSVLPLPEPIASVAPESVCLDENAVLTGDFGYAQSPVSGGAAGTYHWQGPGQIKFTGQTATVTPDVPLYAGEYTLTVTDENGCANFTTTVLTIKPSPSAGILTDKTEGCAPLCTDFRLWDPLNTVKATFTVNNKPFNAKNFSYCFKTPGTFKIDGKFSDSQTGCKSHESLVVNVFPVPEADFYWLPEKPIEGIDEVQFINSSSTGADKFQWYFANDKTYAPESENAHYFYREPGVYPVAFVVENSVGCADTVVKSVTVETDFACYIPNAFTPNTDSNNERFMPVVRGAHKYSLSIYNRWGERVFYTLNPEDGWDGNYGGEPCKQDSYVYKVVLTTVHGEHRQYTGQVMLYR